MELNVPTISSKCKWDEPQCVEVTRRENTVEVRDSKVPNSWTLEFTHEEWEAFTTGVKAGEFDLTKASV